VVNPDTVMGEVVPVAVILPGDDTAVYDVIADPPSLAGAVNATDMLVALATVAVPIVGAPGTVNGMTPLLVELRSLLPAALVAYTVNVYPVPLLNPVIVIGEVDPVAVIPPGEDVTVYDVIADPPLLAGAVNGIVACPLPAVTVPIVGAPGIVYGVTLLLAELLMPLPIEFVAYTVNVYATVLDNPDIRNGEVVPVTVILPGDDTTV